MNPIFVFGSNLAGRHGKGAALYAAQHYGAEPGVGEGRTGNAYAIPTKGRSLEVLPLETVRQGLANFLSYAEQHPNETFILTPVGCGLAGYHRRDIWTVLTRFGVPRNVLLASTWVTP